MAWLLLPLSYVYRLLLTFDRALRSGRRTGGRVPVVVIGNLTVGGTGKTPLVIWLARALRERGLSPGIVSRGYGGSRRAPRRVRATDSPADVGDEPIVLARNAGCPVVVCADRRAAAAVLERDETIDVILSDDGLQHHALARDCEIVVVDGARGLGNGLCLPAGPLREPVARLDRVDAIIVNGGGWSHPEGIVARLEVTGVERLDGTASRNIASFNGQRVHAFAAIGHPQRFFDLLERHGISVVAHAKADHAYISPMELATVTSAIMITEKDAVKLGPETPGDIWCVKVDYVFESGGAERLLATVLDRLAPEAAAS